MNIESNSPPAGSTIQFPTLFVIDHEEIIRYKSRGYEDLDIVLPLVEELVTKLDAERTNGITATD